MRIFRIAAAAALAASASVSIASAQEDIVSEPYRTLPNFDVAHVGPLLKEMGIVWQPKYNNGRPYIEAAIGSDFAFALVPVVCDGADGVSGCKGLSIVAFFGGYTPNPQTVAAFSQKYSFVSAGMLSGSADAYVQRYDVADYGIPRGNLQTILYNFQVVAKQFRGLLSGGMTVSKDGYSDDLVAAGLNARAADAAGIELAVAQSLPQRHLAEFEETPLIVRQLMESGEAPVNKIRNIGAE